MISSPEVVYKFLSTDKGREAFWAESSGEKDGIVSFEFINGQTLESRILQQSPPHRFSLTYFGDSRVIFELTENETGGTDLQLTEEDVPQAEWHENDAGWVSVLLMLKARADFGIDLRNHDKNSTWEEGYVDV